MRAPTGDEPDDSDEDLHAGYWMDVDADRWLLAGDLEAELRGVLYDSDLPKLHYWSYQARIGVLAASGICSTAMGLNLDMSVSFRRSHRLGELVEAIYHASSAITPETNWVEWKSTLDFSMARDKVAAAKAIIAFANRDPANAARECEGEGYLVVGVSPDGVLGSVAVHDAANLSGMLRTYVDGPHWDVDYVEFKGQHVLIITVAPPQPGHRIHSLVKEYDSYKSGTVFRRGISSSEPATHRELNELQNRLLQDPPVSESDTFDEAIGTGNYRLAGRLMRSRARGVIDVCIEPGQFPPTYASRAATEQLVQYVETAERYLKAAAPLLPLVVEGCRVESTVLEIEHRQVITALAEPRPLVQEPGSLITNVRNQQLEALALLPATLTMYAGTLAAVEHDNYGAIRALTVDATVEWSLFSNRKVAVLDKVGPWEIVSHERHLGLALRAAQKGVLTGDLLDALAAGRLPRKPAYPVSAFFFDALRTYFPNHTDSQYGWLFNAAEILFSLLVTDRAAQRNSGLMDQPWLGLFVTHAAESHPFEDTEVARMLADARNAGDHWPPVQAGLFGGSQERLERAVDAVWTATVDQMRRGPF